MQKQNFKAMSNAASKVVWVIRLLHEQGLQELKSVILYCDNQSAMYIEKNPVFHDKTKHIKIACHYTSEKIIKRLLKLACLPSHQQLTDILTNNLPSSQIKQLLFKLGVFVPISPSLRGIWNITKQISQREAKIKIFTKDLLKLLTYPLLA